MANNQRLDATITIGSVLQRSVKQNFNVLRSGLDNVGDRIKEVRDRQRELSRQRRILERQGESVEDLDREYEQLTETLEDLRRKQQRLERTMSSGRRVGDRFGTMMRRVGSLTRTAATGATVLGGALAAVTTRVATGTEQINRFANRLGVSTEYLSQMDYVGRQFGVQTDALADGMKELSLRADEFAVTAAGPAAEAFDRLGLSQQEVNLLSKDTAALFSEVRNRIAEVDDVAARQRIADELFGGTGAEQMAEMLQLSKAEIRQMRQEAVAAGASIDKSQADIARSFTQSFNRLGAIIGGLNRQVTLQSMPALTSTFDDLGDKLISNRERVTKLGASFAENLAAAIPIVLDMAAGVARVGGMVGKAVASLANFVGGWENLGIIVGTVMASKAIFSVGAFVASIFSLGRALFALTPALPLVATGVRAIGTALVANPIGATIMAIATGAYLIMRNWDGISSWFGRLWGKVKAIFSGFSDFVSSVFSAELKSASETVQSAWSGTQSALDTILNGIGGAFDRAWSTMIGPVVDQLENAQQGIVSAWQGVRDSIGNVLDWMGDKFDWILGKLKPVIDGLSWVRDKGAGAVNAVSDFGSNAVDAAGDLGSGAVNAVGDFGSSAIDNVAGFGQSVGDFFSGNDTQERAVGGAFTKSKPLLVGERGPELMYPSQGGFIANNRGLERMVSMSSEIMARLQSIGAPAKGQPQDAAPGINFTPIAKSLRQLGQNIQKAAAVTALAIAGASSPSAADQMEPRVNVQPTPVEVPSVFPRVDAPAQPEPRVNVQPTPVEVQTSATQSAPVMPPVIERIREAPARMQPERTRQAAQVTQNITINAQNMSVEALVDELERRKQQAQESALFDGASGYGQYGGAYG